MKKILIGITVFIALIIFVPQAEVPPPAENVEQTQVHSQEDMQASLLSVSAGNSLIPFIAVLGPLGIGFVFYLRKKDILNRK